MARRAWGSGSLYQVKVGPQAGRWVGAYSIRGPDGRRQRRTVSGKDKAEVRARLRRMVSSTTSRLSGDETLTEYLPRYLEEVAAPSVRPVTLANYRHAASHIIRHIGPIRVKELRPDDVQRCLNTMDTGAPMRKAARLFLGTAMQQALRWGLVASNPVRLVPAPRVPRQPLRAWTAKEARDFIEATKEEPHWPLYVLAVTTGMRSAELRGLRWEDVDLAAGRLRVTRTIRRLSRYRWLEQEPKTERSRRTLPLAPIAVAALEALPHREGFVFRRTDGQPLAPSTVSKWFREACRAHGVRVIRLHDLRHTAAVLLLDATGGDLRLVQSQLGHSSITTTVDVYGGYAEQSRARAAQVMGEIFPEKSQARA